MKKIICSLAVIGGLAFASPVFAQVSGGQVSFGNDGPIDVKAERATYRGAKTVLNGNVQIKQKGVTILANQMDLYRAEIRTQAGVQKDGQEDAVIKLGNINRIVAVGDFKYITPENSVTGDKGVYERDKEIITVIGNAKFIQNNGNTITGNRMVYDLTTNQARADGRCTGRDCNDANRVEIKIGKKK